MEVTLTIAAIGTAVGLAAYLRSRFRQKSSPPLEPELVDGSMDAIRHSPKVADAVRSHSRGFVGGSALIIGLLVIFALAIVAGAMFDMVDDQSGFARFDMALAQWGASNATPASTTALNLLTTIGGTPVVTAVTLLVGWWGWRKWDHPAILGFLASVAIGQSLVANAIKWTVMRPRPDLSQLASFGGSSFPSGHSAAAAATYAGVALVLSIGRTRGVSAMLGAAAATLGAAVASSRALLGVHWLTDIIAGVAVGWAWFVICAIVFGGRLMQFGEVRDELVDPTRHRGHLPSGSAFT